MFNLNGVLEGLIVFCLIAGFVVGSLIAAPAYYFGKAAGREAVRVEAQSAEVLTITYDVKTGDKIYTWVRRK